MWTIFQSQSWIEMPPDLVEGEQGTRVIIFPENVTLWIQILASITFSSFIFCFRFDVFQMQQIEVLWKGVFGTTFRVK